MMPGLLPRLLVLLGVAVLAGTPAAAQAPGGPPAVGVIQVQKRAVTETEEFVGRIQAINRVDLNARVTAFVQEKLFTEGAEVKAGDLLYRLERAPFEAAVMQQQAAVSQNTALLQNAVVHTNRAQTLLNTPAGQRSNFEDAQAQQASLAAQVASAQAQLRNAQINLAYTEIRAPVDGKIGLTQFTVGNVVTPTSGPLSRIVSQDPMYVLFPMAVRSVIALNKRYADRGGMQAVTIKLRLPDGTMFDQNGSIDFTDPSVSVSTDTIAVRGKIANPIRIPGANGAPAVRTLTDGEFVTVTVAAIEPIQALAIPRAAVLQDQQGSYVYIVDKDNKAQQRRIILGQSTPELAIITSGLSDGETVVLDGIQRVRPGAPVTPGPASPTPGWPAPGGPPPAPAASP
jgi:membrane fusion protein (multidrug efflux system)